MRVTLDLTDEEYERIRKYADLVEFGNKSTVIRKALRDFFAKKDKQRQVKESNA